VAVALLLAVVQAVELRGTVESLSPALQQTVKQLRENSPFLDNDRALEQELRQCVRLVLDRFWKLYD
jgi:histidine ammonia-lyase